MRWLLWNLRCLRGRRCANVVPEGETNAHVGAVLALDYTCGSCGTQYRAHYTWDGRSWNGDRAIVQVKEAHESRCSMS